MTFPGGATKNKSYVDVQPDGHPPHSMAEWYVALDEIGVNTPGLEQEYLEEVYTIGAWITKRTGRNAPDRYLEVLKQDNYGLLAIERQVIVLLHNQQDVRAAANTLGGLPDNTGPGDSILQPLWYLGRGKLSFRGSDWLGADGDESFVVRQLRFGGGKRIQAIDVMG